MIQMESSYMLSRILCQFNPGIDWALGRRNTSLKKIKSFSLNDIIFKAESVSRVHQISANAREITEIV